MSFSAVNAANVQDNSSNDLFSHDVFQSAELPVSDNQLASDNENDLLTVSADDDILSVSADDVFSAVSDGDDSLAVSDGDDSLAVSEDNLLTVSADDEKLGEDETGSFNELQSIIDSNYGSTIVLDKSYAYSANDKTIEIKDSIIIDGNGFTIDGKNAVQIMNVTSNDVTIRNLTFVNGLLRRYYPGTAPDTSWTGYFGADISWIGDNGRIENCIFENSTLNPPLPTTMVTAGFYQYGGALYLQNFTNGVVNNCTFRNLRALAGGGIYIWSTEEDSNITISNSSFVNCTAYEWRAGGGAILVGAKKVNITQCNFTDNSAIQGGAVLIMHGSRYDTTVPNSTYPRKGISYMPGDGTVIEDCKFTNNTGGVIEGESGGYGGSAVYIGAPDCIIRDSTFDNNTNGMNGGGYGGAIMILINNPSASDVPKGVNATIFNCNFTGNNASSSGGSAYYGGAICQLSSYTGSFNTNISQCIFKENYAGYGGALYLLGSNTVDNCTFINNTANGYGGALYLTSSDNNVAGCVFEENKAENAQSTISNYGGAVYIGGSSYSTGSAHDNLIDNCSFEKNTADYGGAVYVANTGENTTIKDSNFTENSAQLQGGAVAVYAPTEIISSRFDSNTAENGGAMYWKDSDGEITDSNYTKNRAFSGSAIFLDSGYLNISDSSFFSNLANASALEMNGVDSSLPNKVVVDGDKVSFHANFTGHDNINNAIFNNQEDAGRIKFKNVDFHGYNGNTGSSLVDTVNGYQNSENGVLPYQDDHEGLIPINFEVEKIDGDSAVLVANLTNNTKIDGFAEIIDLVLAPGKYRVTAIHYLDDYYTEVRSEAQEFVIRGNSSAHADDVEVTYDSDVVVAVETEYATGLKDIVIMDEDGTTLAVDFELVKIDDNHYEVTIKGLDVGKYSINFTTQVGDDYISECTNSSKIRVNPAPSYVWGEDVDVIFGEPIVIPVESVNATGIAYQIIDGSDNVVAEGALEVGGSIKDLDLPAGEYTVILTSVTDENHDSVSNTSNLIVRHKITVVLDPVIGYTGEYKDFHAHVFDENGNPVDGGEAVMTIVYTNRLALAISMNFLLNAADETYSASVVNGEAVFPNIKLGEPGVYPSQVLYTNDYASVKNESTVTILKLNTTVKGDDVSGKPGDSKSISVDVLDQNGNPVENGTVTLTLNGKTYNATVKNGKAVFDVVLPDPGDYEAVVKYEGNDYYNPSGSTIKVHVDKINTSPSADDVTGKKNEKKDITVNIVDENGKPVKNGTATLKIGGKSYNAEVVNGVAVFKDVELPSDDAVAEVIYHGNEYYNSSSTTFSIKIDHDNGNNESEPSNGKSAKLPVSSATGNPFALLLISLVVLVSNSIFIRRK